MIPRMASDERELYADRAVRAYRAMLRRFRKRSGVYRYDQGPGLFRSAALWPFARALVATLDVAGIEEGGPAGLDMQGLLSEHLELLERYWDPAGPAPAYCSDVSGASRHGDRYYDDNAWVGLALVELERLRPGSGWLNRASELFDFAQSGWDGEHGGVFWVEQGRGTGIKNHDRNTVSNAPNAELGLHVAELATGGASVSPGAVTPSAMYRWVLDTLDSSHGGASPGTGLFWDRIRDDGSIDKITWSYNQGSMIGTNVLLARAEPEQRGTYLGLAEAIAQKALRKFAGEYEKQPPAFNAIFFRNLLLLHDSSQDEELRGEITAAMRAFADAAWHEARDRRDLFHLRGLPRLLDQSAMVQVLALLAWDPARYGRVA
jgi:Glycosyl hydrolase family 76